MAKLDPYSNIPDIIVEESTRLNHIITDFLDFAKPKVPDLRPCIIDEVIEKNLIFLASQIQEAKIHIKTQYQENIPEIMADTAMLYQSFLNIY